MAGARFKSHLWQLLPFFIPTPAFKNPLCEKVLVFPMRSLLYHPDHTNKNPWEKATHAIARCRLHHVFMNFQRWAIPSLCSGMGLSF
ncbi:MAG: hypothetical protein BWX80_03836 [Candidatus Hydrogenedentes bacterium ADurb.Bin101]|nr:MAG: hypothetical protein BWX80_03836 [Candidatus Hydrogenedentes bacterium ADurb.Bin101]